MLTKLHGAIAMAMKQFFSTTEAAKMLGISRIAVFKKIRQGRMASVMIGGSYAIRPAAIAQEKMRMDKRESARILRRKRRRRS
ncbi:MAG: excisionase family DNA-binding protein [Pseudomonadota bacterium]